LIISASRRTDIPTYYSAWFLKRIRDGYVYVRNPMNPRRISRISLSPSVVDGIVFWTKNPVPMMPHLDSLRDYAYCFQFTVTSYGKDIEPNVPGKNDVILPAFRELSEKVGPERIIWRYDPILLTEKYTVDYHVQSFSGIAGRLSGYTHKCVISFVDFYRNTQSQLNGLGIFPMGEKQMYELAERLSEKARKYGITLESCAEEIDLTQFGIKHSHCIDGALFEKILNCKLNTAKDKNQRPECGCMESIDIGAYNTCRNGCRYCYANYIPNTVGKNAAMHNPESPLLIGEVTAEDRIVERQMRSLRENQLKLF